MVRTDRHRARRLSDPADDHDHYDQYHLDDHRDLDDEHHSPADALRRRVRRRVDRDPDGESTLVAVATYNSLGQPTAEPVSVAVVCGPGAGSGQSFPTNLP